MKCDICGANHLIVSELAATLAGLRPTDELRKNDVGNLIVVRVTNRAKDEWLDLGWIDLRTGMFQRWL